MSRVKDNAGVEGGDDDGIFHKFALMMPEEKDASKGIWERTVKNQVWDLEESRILELKEEKA